MQIFSVFLVFFTLIYCESTQGKTVKVKLKMPAVQPKKADSYICTSMKLPPGDSYIVEYEPHAHKETVHHMLLYGCDVPGSSKKSWDCGVMGAGICGRSESILFGWARDAPPFQLPKDVGFKVGGDTHVRYLVLQLHYVHPLKDGQSDSSGLTLHMTSERQLNLASIYLLMAWNARIPPHSKGIHVDIACKYNSDQEIHAFAFRTHAHDLGRVITGYRVRSKVWKQLGKGDPHAPQAFYPMKNITTIRKGDILAARCTYDSVNSQKTEVTRIGPTSNDEMCNFYMMFYRDARSHATLPDMCADQSTFGDMLQSFPKDSDTPLSSSTVHHHHNHHHADEHAATNELRVAKTSSTPLQSKNNNQAHRNISTDVPPTNFVNDVTGSDVTGSDLTDSVVIRGKSHLHTTSRVREITELADSDGSNRVTNGVITDVKNSTVVSERTTSMSRFTVRPTTESKTDEDYGSHTEEKPESSTVDKKQTMHTSNQVVLTEEKKVNNSELSTAAAPSQRSSDNLGDGISAVESWPSDITKGLGQVTGLDVDSTGHLFVFHRAERTWGFGTFDDHNKFRHPARRGAIRGPTILVVDSKSGKILEKKGQNMFYLPHGLTIDHEDNVWVTDVALHQVKKFSRGNLDQPSLVLGKRLSPGSDKHHFCKPTDVSVEKSGVFYVADGYCNGRIMKFSPKGLLLKTWGKPSVSSDSGPGTFFIPHSLALDENHGMLYVADRENGRIQCFDTEGKFHKIITSSLFGGRVFAVDYNNRDNVLYAVNGPGSSKVQGFTIDPTSGKVLASWSPRNKGFSQPHDVISSSSDIYIAEIGPNKVWKMHTRDQDKVMAGSKEMNFGRGINDAVKNEPSRPSDDGTTSSDRKSRKHTEKSSRPAIVILTILSIPVLILVIVGVVSKVKGRKTLPKYDMMDETLGNPGASNWCTPVNCCTKPYRNMEELYLMDSDSDLEIFPDVRVNKK